MKFAFRRMIEWMTGLRTKMRKWSENVDKSIAEVKQRLLRCAFGRLLFTCGGGRLNLWLLKLRGARFRRWRWNPDYSVQALGNDQADSSKHRVVEWATITLRTTMKRNPGRRPSGWMSGQHLVSELHTWMMRFCGSSCRSPSPGHLGLNYRCIITLQVWPACASYQSDHRQLGSPAKGHVEFSTSNYGGLDTTVHSVCSEFRAWSSKASWGLEEAASQPKCFEFKFSLQLEVVCVGFELFWAIWDLK